MWVEGMFLRHHHFQQQDRYLEAVMRDRVGALHPFHWGLSRAEVDGAALQAGAFGLSRAAGTMPDGLSFSFPDRDPMPPRLEIDRDTVNQTVYLVAPEGGAGKRLASAPRPGGAQVSTRYVVEEGEATDALDEGSTCAMRSAIAPAPASSPCRWAAWRSVDRTAAWCWFPPTSPP
jgi:type VI secretion system protein ImpJ